MIYSEFFRMVEDRICKERKKQYEKILLTSVKASGSKGKNEKNR